jgi:hypothetical protein
MCLFNHTELVPGRYLEENLFYTEGMFSVIGQQKSPVRNKRDTGTQELRHTGTGVTRIATIYILKAAS